MGKQGKRRRRLGEQDRGIAPWALFNIALMMGAYFPCAVAITSLTHIHSHTLPPLTFSLSFTLWTEHCPECVCEGTSMSVCKCILPISPTNRSIVYRVSKYPKKSLTFVFSTYCGEGRWANPPLLSCFTGLFPWVTLEIFHLCNHLWFFLDPGCRCVVCVCVHMWKGREREDENRSFMVKAEKSKSVPLPVSQYACLSDWQRRNCVPKHSWANPLLFPFPYLYILLLSVPLSIMGCAELQWLIACSGTYGQIPD